jgi:hypothetical protein
MMPGSVEYNTTWLSKQPEVEGGFDLNWLKIF